MRDAHKPLHQSNEKYCKWNSFSADLSTTVMYQKINAAAGKSTVQVAEHTFSVIKKACELYEKTEKRFDITITPLLDVWDFKRRHSCPSSTSIKEALAYVNANDILLDDDTMNVGLRRQKQSMDLGGIAKGYASDQARQILEKHGISSAYLNMGGNVVVIGEKPNGKPWRVGIRHPRKDDALLGVLEVIGTSVVTSGDYERFFIDENGKRWHHILDPTTGYSAESDLISVTVVCQSSSVADVLATTLCILGSEKIPFIQQQFPEVEIIAVDRAGSLYMTEHIVEYFHPR